MERSESSDRNTPDDLPDDPAGTSILDLNQYCLLQVFSYLDVYDAIQFGETCKSLNVVLRLAVIKYKNFDLVKYDLEDGRRTWRRFNVPLEKELFYVAPHIESLKASMEVDEIDDSVPMRYYPEGTIRKIAERLHTFLQFDMPKLKTVAFQSSSCLAYILNRASINKLTIYQVQPDDLNLYAGGLRNLTQLHLNNIHVLVSFEEISAILDNNPNIEDLCLVYDFEIESFGQRKFPDNFIQKLPHLKNLKLSIGRDASETLQSILQIQQLSKLSLVVREAGHNDRYLNEFLKRLGKKNRVRSIELKGILGSDGGSALLDTLASMNLSSLTLHPTLNMLTLHSALTRHAKLQTLQILKLCLLTDINQMILIVERFKSLKRLVYRRSLDESDSSVLVQPINQLLNINATTRPDVEVEVLHPYALIKISFYHGTYDIICWPETRNYSCTTFTDELHFF